MRIITAGESHGEYLSVIIEGFPKGVVVDAGTINQELKKRMAGYGRGKRMSIESDKVHIISGLRNKTSLGSPIAMLIKNRDWQIFAQDSDKLPAINLPRPAHADLAGALKYGENDVRNILERASARETAMRVCAGSACKQFLKNFGVEFASFTVSIGEAVSLSRPANIKAIQQGVQGSQLNCIDRNKEKAMISEIEKAQKKGDSLGGVIEVWASGVCPGLGSCMQYDKRLDALLASAMISIPSIKGVEMGLGFEYARMPGSKGHDEIFYSKQKGFYHNTNNSGGIEGGMSSGEPIVLRVAMKPIATLITPLHSVNLLSKKEQKAAVVRSDTCAVAAAGAVAESMMAITLAQAYMEKFGCDGLSEIVANFKNYMKSIR